MLRTQLKMLIHFTQPHYTGCVLYIQPTDTGTASVLEYKYSTHFPSPRHCTGSPHFSLAQQDNKKKKQAPSLSLLSSSTGRETVPHTSTKKEKKKRARGIPLSFPQAHITIRAYGI